jgi:hypothetical protein
MGVIKEFEADVETFVTNVMEVTTTGDGGEVMLARVSRVEMRIVGELPQDDLRSLIHRRVKVIVLD